jgi:hypothetical protein
MPINSTIDHSRDLTIHTGTGDVSFEEVMTTLRQSWEGQTTKNALWDARKAKTPDLSSHDLERIADYIMTHAEKRAGGKSAMVAPSELEYGLSRVYDAWHDIRRFPFQFRVFRSIEEANEWLDKD